MKRLMLLSLSIFTTVSFADNMAPPDAVWLSPQPEAQKYVYPNNTILVKGQTYSLKTDEIVRYLKSISGATSVELNSVHKTVQTYLMELQFSSNSEAATLREIGFTAVVGGRENHFYCNLTIVEFPKRNIQGTLDLTDCQGPEPEKAKELDYSQRFLGEHNDPSLAAGATGVP